METTPVTPALWRLEAGGSEVQVYSGLHSTVWGQLDYLRPCLKNKNKPKTFLSKREKKQRSQKIVLNFQ